VWRMTGTGPVLSSGDEKVDVADPGSNGVAPPVPATR
jgi:hypothetical protein